MGKEVLEKKKEEKKTMDSLTPEKQGSVKEKLDHVKRVQKLLQANFLKAAQMDDPEERAAAMTKLQRLQIQTNNGENLEIIESMLTDEGKAAFSSLEKVKEQAKAKVEINETQVQLS